VDPDLLQILVVLSPVLAIGVAAVLWSAASARKARAAFAQNGWGVWKRRGTADSRACFETVEAVLKATPHAAWGATGIYWFGCKRGADGSDWILLQYQHVSALTASKAKPVPLAIAGVLRSTAGGVADIRRVKEASTARQDLFAALREPVPTGDSRFDAEWAVLAKDPVAVKPDLTPERLAWIASLPRGYRCMIVPGAILMIADRWFAAEDCGAVDAALARCPP
jgi:hypothetical protein